MDKVTTESRELTRSERATIRKLVVGMCANYDHEYGCLPLECPCYMLNKWWTGAYCKYFQNAVLPLNPKLEATLTGRKPLRFILVWLVANHLSQEENRCIVRQPVQISPGANGNGDI